MQGAATSGHAPLARAEDPCTTLGNSWDSAGQNPGAWPSTYRTTGTCLPAVVWAPEVPPVPWRSMAQPVVLSIPSLSHVPNLLFYLGCLVEKIFPPAVAGGT